MAENSQDKSWLNRTVLGVGLTSLFSDWSHETATAVLPAFLAAIGAGPAWLGLIEGIADGLSSFTKLAAGHYTDRLKRRKPLAIFGYVVTALGTASFALATNACQVLIGRSLAWLGRGVRSHVFSVGQCGSSIDWHAGVGDESYRLLMNARRLDFSRLSRLAKLSRAAFPWPS